MSAAPAQDDTPDPILISRRGLGIGVALLTLAFGVVIIAGAMEFSVGWTERGPEPGYFPFWIGCVIIAGSIATLTQAWLAKADGATAGISRGQARRALAFLLPLIGFVALSQIMGLYVASIVYLFATMMIQGGYGALAAAVTSLGTAVALYVMFDKWLKVPLAKGPIEAWLGIY
jgi:Tripartite tricarboxylate transporter TctB family